MIIKRIFTIILPLSVILLIVWVFRFWFSPDVISSGDFGYLSNNAIDRLYIYPYLWNTSFGSGLGGNITYILALNTFYYASALLLHNIFRFGWEVIERIVWFWPFLLISVLTSTYLFKKMFPQNNFWIFSSLIFLFNTYTLMLVSGGQMGVAMAYAVAPLVLAQFIRLVNNATFRRAIVTGLTLSLLILFDPRIAYVVLLGVLLYWVIAMIFEKTVSIRKVFFLGIPIVIAGLIHAFWILPLLWFQVNPIESLGSAYNSLVSVKFFSFADFSHALSLLHPNWPENLFGKVYFLQPEFLIIPILAFSSLLFIKPKSDNRRPASPAGGPVIFFALLAIVGIFLSKGANPPAGGIYLWLFAHVPGFNVFRDPTKFYLLTAIAYSMLIPVALDRIGKKVLIIVFVLFWLFTIRQAVAGQIGGTFASHTVPSEYEVLKDVINQPDYFRTFWVPHTQRYGFSTYIHPAIDATSILDTTSPSAMLAWLDSQEGANQLARWSVKYVIVPYDSQGEIFLNDRKYSEQQRDLFQIVLDINRFMDKKILPGISPKLSVYETRGYNDHLWLEDYNKATLSWHMISPTSYAISISDLESPGKLIFSESYDPYWQLDIGGRIIRSQKTNDSLNSFSIPAVKNANGNLEYLPQRYVWIGLVISVVAIIGAVVALAVLQ